MDFQQQTTSSITKCRNLTNQERRSVYEELLKISNDGKLKTGSLSMVAATFSVSTKTIHRIWKQAQSFSPDEHVNVSSKRLGRVGRKRVQIDREKVLGVPLSRRTNIRSMSIALDVAKSTLHRRVKEGALRPHSNAIKPTLTDANKRVRLEFCLSMLESNSLHNNPKFKDMLNYVHIDEKWFYMTKESQKYYLLPDEEEPERSCKSKRFITKVMFLAAVARPRFDSSSNQEFSGKIGIFPFTFKEPAKRRSKNRDAGTLETKPIASITKEVVRECLIHKVLPVIRDKWPLGSRMEPIYIQQDNAKPHINPNDAEFLEAACANGFDIRLSFQPPNSPDMNVLDLGFFRAIQSLQHQQAPATIDDLVAAVEKSFDDLSSQSLGNIFLSLQNCMIEVMKNNGGNHYKLPHMGKGHLDRAGILPFQLEVDNQLVEKVLDHLQQIS